MTKLMHQMSRNNIMIEGSGPGSVR